jgi:hypothetical protein
MDFLTFAVPTGLQQLWTSGSWKDLVGPDGLSSSSSRVLQCPTVDAAARACPKHTLTHTPPPPSHAKCVGLF